MLREGHHNAWQAQGGTADHDRTKDTGLWGAPGDLDGFMIPPEAGPTPAACDADPRCRRAACFQIQLEASQPQQAYRQAHACAHHVADVIEALRGWAREHDMAGGQLTILAIEPTAGERAENATAGSGGAGGAKSAALREFAFSTIPLKTIPPGPASQREPAS